MPPTPEKSKETLEAKSAFTATLLNIGSTHASPLVERAHTITENAAALDKQQAELESHTATLAKQNESWDKLAGEARDGLKEIGDVQNWAEVVERELLVLEQTLKYVEDGEGHSSSDTGEGGRDLDEEEEDVVVDGVNGNTRDGAGKGNTTSTTTDSTSTAVDDANDNGGVTSGSGSGSGSSSWFKWW